MHCIRPLLYSKSLLKKHPDNTLPPLEKPSLPALLNAIKMIHTIARYYNTTERMTNLLTKITNQMILNCKMCILGENEDAEQLWNQEPTELVGKGR